MATRRTAALLAHARPTFSPCSPSTSRSFFGLPSPFSSPAPASTARGTLQTQNGLTIYTESRPMPYSPKQLYAIIADVDSYHSFLPFATASKVLLATRVSEKGKERCEVREKGWLRGQGEGEGERWEMDAELRIGAMGYEEGYVSLVETRKWDSVKATAKDSSLFKHLVTRWTLSPLPPLPSAPARPRTQVDLDLTYAFASPFHAAAVSAVWEKVSGMMVSGFEKRAEEVYGK